MSALTLLCLLCLACVSIYRLRPPEVAPSGASPTEFSAERAMTHLFIISDKPHPLGSAEHQRVQDYIVSQLTALGVEHELQEAAGITNIVARLKGATAGKGVLVVGHYDTVPVSPGASDDGSAVALMLETIRALKAGAPLRHDVMLLFSDGEEVGLRGAKAFVYQHAWAKDVGLVLNFDTRGTSGPSIMFETSGENGWLIKQFAAASPRPVAISISQEVYKLMPNSTDFQIFREAGFDGLNFAFIDGFRHYHSPTDTVSEIDRRSLQHQGENALALARHLADENLENVRAPDAIYFDIFGSALITYPASRATLLTLLTAIFFIGVVALGLKKRRLTMRGIGVGSVTVLSSMCAACVVATLVRFVLGAWRGDQSLASGDGLDMIALAAAGVAVASVLYVGVSRRINALNLLAGGLLWWLIFLVLATLFSPGSTYLFTWPLLFNLVASACIFLAPAGAPFALKHLSLLALGGLSGALLLVPVVYLASVALTPGSFGALVSASASQALLLVPFSPHLSALFSPKRVNRH